jgi:hypothetical protein
MALFWKVLETLGGGTQLEEVGHGGMPKEAIPRPSPFLGLCVLAGMREQPLQLLPP